MASCYVFLMYVLCPGGNVLTVIQAVFKVDGRRSCSNLFNVIFEYMQNRSTVFICNLEQVFTNWFHVIHGSHSLTWSNCNVLCLSDFMANFKLIFLCWLTTKQRQQNIEREALRWTYFLFRWFHASVQSMKNGYHVWMFCFFIYFYVN